MEQCTGTVKKISLVLGGNAPFIVVDDADIEMTVKRVIVSKYRKAGENCVCANRALVQDGVNDAFTKPLAETAGAMKVGDASSRVAIARALANGPSAPDREFVGLERRIKELVCEEVMKLGVL
jgi:succinate-semialdehyde dehydrogenase / glutarate-semialdehyde dehydrogenase